MKKVKSQGTRKFLGCTANVLIVIEIEDKIIDGLDSRGVGYKVNKIG